MNAHTHAYTISSYIRAHTNIHTHKHTFSLIPAGPPKPRWMYTPASAKTHKHSLTHLWARRY